MSSWRIFPKDQPSGVARALRMHYSVACSADDLDVALCVNSGQVFRWESTGDSEWLGVDGCHWFHVKGSLKSGPKATKSLSIHSNAGPEQFRSLFRLDEDHGACRKE